jgi:hypothetical protein
VATSRPSGCREQKRRCLKIHGAKINRYPLVSWEATGAKPDKSAAERQMGNLNKDLECKSSHRR